MSHVLYTFNSRQQNIVEIKKRNFFLIFYKVQPLGPNFLFGNKIQATGVSNSSNACWRKKPIVNKNLGQIGSFIAKKTIVAPAFSK